MPGIIVFNFLVANTKAKEVLREGILRKLPTLRRGERGEGRGERGFF
jgi:hypothetical protein